MEILPAWLIAELKRLEELKEQREQPRVSIELPHPVEVPPFRPKADGEEAPQPDKDSITFSFI